VKNASSEDAMTKETLEALIGRLEFWALIFGALVVIGVAGETFFGVRIWWNNRKLHTIQDSENEELRLKISQANDRTAAAESQIALLNAQAKQAEAKASQAQLDLARFKAPRALTDEQAKVIAEKLKQFGPQAFEVTTYWDSVEPMAFSQRLADILVRSAGWKLEQPKAFHALLGGLVGVQVYVHPLADDQTRAAASALVAVLTEEGVFAKLKLETTENNPKHNKIALNIGTKQ
jgi:hypothetical protein